MKYYVTYFPTHVLTFNFLVQVCKLYKFVYMSFTNKEKNFNVCTHLQIYNTTKEFSNGTIIILITIVT